MSRVVLRCITVPFPTILKYMSASKSKIRDPSGKVSLIAISIVGGCSIVRFKLTTASGPYIVGTVGSMNKVIIYETVTFPNPGMTMVEFPATGRLICGIVVKNAKIAVFKVYSDNISYRSLVKGLNPGVTTAGSMSYGVLSPYGWNSANKSNSNHRFVTVGGLVKL
jgi:hypothetical protein